MTMNLAWKLGTAIVVVTAAQAVAQTKTPQLEEITVTAQRREQSLQDTPVAVTAFTVESIERQHIKTTTDLIHLVPNMSGGEISGVGGANNYSLRGLYNAETAATFDSPLGHYVDGVYIARINASNFSMFDVERVEVLRGPQGTLFGRNNTSGAINVTLKKPGDEPGGNVEIEAGGRKHLLARGAVDIPFSDKFRTRVAAYNISEEGWLKNVTTGGTNNDNDSGGGRIAFSADLADGVRWDVAGDIINDHHENIPGAKVNGTWTSNSGLIELGSLVSARQSNIPGNFIGNKTKGLASTFNIESGVGTFDIITAYRHIDTQYNVDFFDGPFPIGGFASVQDSKHNQFTQEVKLVGDSDDGRVNYTVGAFYLHESSDTAFTSVFRLASGVPFIDADRTFLNKVSSFAGYAQADYNLSDQVKLTGGLRWTHEKKTIHYENNNNPRASVAITDALLTSNGIPLEKSVSLATPRLALEWRPIEDVMYFASVTRGFRSGGWNVRGTNATILRDFNPEKIWSYEVGTRADLADKRFRINVTGFYGDVGALQIATASIAPSGAPQFPIGNFADLESYGIEVESVLAAADGFNITATLGYNETNYRNLTQAVFNQQAACQASITANAAARPQCAAGIIRLDGTIADPARSPKFSASIGASYEFAASDAVTITPSVNLRHTSKFNTNAAQIALGDQPGYELMTASVTFALNDLGVSISGGCDNCTDEAYKLTTIGGRFWYNEPRTWYARLRYTY